MKIVEYNLTSTGNHKNLYDLLLACTYSNKLEVIPTVPLGTFSIAEIACSIHVDRGL